MFTPRKCTKNSIAHSPNLQKLQDADLAAVTQLREAVVAIGGLEVAAAFVGRSVTTLWRWSNGLSPIEAGKLKALCAETGVQSVRLMQTGDYPIAEERGTGT